jgi:hypothetical protein
MNISKFITGFKRFLVGVICIPAILFNIFLVFSLFADKVMILNNQGYWVVFNTFLGVGSLIYMTKATKYFDLYKKWKEEAIYQKQLKKGTDDRYTDELVDIRRESFWDF